MVCLAIRWQIGLVSVYRFTLFQRSYVVRFPPFCGDIFFEEELCLELKEFLMGGFCDGAVRFVSGIGRSVFHVAGGLGVSEGTLGRWVR